jgi:twitching motility protein PilT
VDVFPVHQQAQVRYQLSSTIQGIINQRLLPRLDKQGRVLACEILIANDAVRALIRENKHHQLENVIATGSKFGMQALENELQNLYDQGVISYDVFTSFKPRHLAQGTHKEGGH